MHIISGGDIILSPSKVYPLKGYDQAKYYDNRGDFFKNVESKINEWYSEFPECCEAHKRLKTFGDFKKENYDPIPKQIEHSLSYLLHVIDLFIDKETWYVDITDYIDYLDWSLGSPKIGGHLLESIAKYIIENFEFSKPISDDKRLELLLYFEPSKRPDDYQERELDVLYEAFQLWLEHLPSIGLFENLKKRMVGKIPMNLFMVQPRANKYTGMVMSKMKSKSELYLSLTQLMNSMCKTINETLIKENNISENKISLIKAAEEKLRIESEILFDNSLTTQQLNYCEVITKWLNMLVEYYKVFSLNEINFEQQKNTKAILELQSTSEDLINQSELFNAEMLGLCSKSLKNSIYYEKIQKDLQSLLISVNEYGSSSNEIENMFKLIYDKLDEKLGRKNEAILFEKLDSPDFSVKHKLKLSIPIFIGLKYEGEISLGKTDKLPSSFSELKRLLVKE